MSKTPPPLAISEELLEKTISILEGPVNTVGEKILGSKLVLAPLSLGLNLTLRAMAFMTGRRPAKEQR